MDSSDEQNDNRAAGERGWREQDTGQQGSSYEETKKVKQTQNRSQKAKTQIREIKSKTLKKQET